MTDPGFVRCAFTGRLEASEVHTRSLEGRAVPYNEVGYTSMGPAIVEPGAVDAGARPTVLRDHDATKVIGVVVDAADDGDGITARVRVSSTVLGDETLTLAADGALAGYSVGLEVTDYRYEQMDGHGDVLVITAADWRELSVVPFPAYQTARIASVAASAETNQPTEETTVNTDTDTATVTATVPDTTPTAPVVPTITARDRVPALNAGQVANVMWLAQAGDQRARELFTAILAAQPPTPDLVLAALAGETTTTSDGIVPPAYTSDLLGGLPVATPFLSNLVRKSALPATGMSIIKPVWESVPAGAWVPVENAAAPTSPATIGSKNVGVLTYAHAVQASLNLVNRSAFGGYANSYYEQTGIDYLAKKESKAVATAQGAATAVSLAGVATTVGAIGKLVAACIAQQTDTANPDGPEFRGLLPEYAAVAADLWSDLVETKALNGPAFSSGSIQWGQLSGSLSGLVVMMVPALTAGKLMVGARAATVVHDENELQLRSTVVNTLSVELGVIGNAAFDVEYPDALAKGAAPFTPTGTTAPAAAKSK